MKNKKILCLAVIFFALISLSLSFIDAEQNITNSSTEQGAGICLNDSRQVMTDMQNENFSIQRVNDSLKQLENSYIAQLALKEKKKNYDFSFAVSLCEEIKKIKENALESRDSLNALKKFYNESMEPGMNTDSVDVLISEAESELRNERYEKISGLVDNAYRQITNIKSNYNTLNVFYETTTASIGKFIDKNKYYFAGAIIVLAILFFIYKNTLFRWNLRKKIKNLELKKETLKEMIRDTQKSYFEKGSVSEGTFNIKTQKLAELIRDIDRQIPLLQEGLAKLNFKKTNGEEKQNKTFFKSFSKINIKKLFKHRKKGI